MAVIAINVLWTAESLMTIGLGWVQANLLGVVFVIAQALAVAGFAALQAYAICGLRRTA